MMPEIAYTSMGRNALVAGLIGHAAALVLGMMTASGAGAVFQIVYLLSCCAFVAGAYAEFTDRGAHPFLNGRFYLIAAVTVIPVLGPLMVLGLIYNFPSTRRAAPGNWFGLVRALLRLRANALLVFLLLVLIFLLFAVLHTRNDPYFRRRVPDRSAQSPANEARQQAPAVAVIPAREEMSC